MQPTLDQHRPQTCDQHMSYWHCASQRVKVFKLKLTTVWQVWMVRSWCSGIKHFNNQARGSDRSSSLPVPMLCQAHFICNPRPFDNKRELHRELLTVQF
eukprot:6490117-Amphidinium_carterae.3